MITCSEAIKNATGKDYSVEEVDEFVRQAEMLKQRIYLNDSIANKDEAIQQALNDVTTEMVETAKIEKRNALINQKRQLEAIDFVQNAFPEDIGRGVQALIAGDNQVARGSRLSVDAEQKSLSGVYIGGMLADLDKVGLLKLAGNGDIDRDIARHMWGEEVADSNARAIGDIYQKYQEMSRLDANQAGAWIKKDPNYVARQSHDVDKIAKATEEEWIAFTLPKLDERTFDGVEDIQGFMAAVYKGLSSGIHKSGSPKSVEDAMKQFKGPGNVAKRMSQGRVLHFKNSDSFMDYNETFGTNSLAESINMSLSGAAESTGLMRHLGTNPENMVDSIYDNFIDEFANLDELTKSKKYTSNLLKVVNGETRMAGSQMFAANMSAVRNWLSMSKLGGALLSSFGADNVAYAAEVRYQGGNMFSGLAESMQGIMKGRRSADQRAIAANLGVTMDSFAGTLAGRFNVNDGHAGLTQKMMNQFFRWNGLAWWTDSLKVSAAIGMSNRLYQQKDLAFDAIDPRLKRVMKLYGIEDNEWSIVSKGFEIDENGTGLLTPEGQREIPDEIFAQSLESQGMKPSKVAIRDYRTELESKLRNYVSDRQGFAVLEGDTRSTATWTQGTQRGTKEGELIRAIGQFKQFPTVFLQRVIGREVTGRMKGSEMGIDKFTDSPMYGVASLMTALTISGYVSMSAKDMAKGRTPREFNDDPSHNMSIVGAAMIQGGGLGIYGDFLFGDMSRFGGGPIETLAGPTIGLGGDIIKLWQKAKNGDDPSASALTLSLNNTPGLNLFYSRIALDYLFLYDLRESMNPGYMKRMEKRIKKENDQEFLYPPSSHAARPVQEIMK